MIGLLLAIIVFNSIAFKTNKRFTAKQIAHIWMFTTAFQVTFDIYIDLKYQGYWYFTKAIEWEALPAHIVLLPPVNMMFLHWFPFGSSFLRRLLYFIYWESVLLVYEVVTMLPEPWGYFRYGWWNLGYSALLNPVLLIILVLYYKKFIK